MNSDSIEQANSTTTVTSDKGVHGSSEVERHTSTSATSKVATQTTILLFLIAFRLVNALALQTFFQPDEYYQALEPAWAFASGEPSGAWITWEWHHHLRSALHPMLFAACYKLVYLVPHRLLADTTVRASFLLAVPKVVQAVIAACGDYYTYKLARYVYGKEANATRLALLFTVCSAWNWFCSTRTFSNCLETTLTVIALYHWPYHWALGVDEHAYQVDEYVMRIRESDEHVGAVLDETAHLRRAILAAALATMLRPTNAIIWLTLTLSTFGRGIWMYGMHWEITALVREGLLGGSLVLTFSTVVDRLFYRTWTLPAWNFLKFNVFQSLAVFYGNNDWHYYLSQGYPILLIVLLVPTVSGLFDVLVSTRATFSYLSIQSQLVVHRLALISVILPAVLSCLAHKEIRFIYPVLPALHVIAVGPTMRYFGLDRSATTGLRQAFRNQTVPAKAMAISMLVANISIAYYFSVKHNSGLIGASHYLRHRFETEYMTTSAKITSPESPGKNLTFAALMPCHSLPWRSHLQYPPSTNTSGISGWALTCEPPLNLSPTAKVTYLDEADIFYADPQQWLERNMARDLPRPSHQHPGIDTAHNNLKTWIPGHNAEHERNGVWLEQAQSGVVLATKRRAWPKYLLFFEQLEPLMVQVLGQGKSGYTECTRLWNSRFHDDWRRRGDVVVWCLDQQAQEQQ